MYKTETPSSKIGDLSTAWVVVTPVPRLPKILPRDGGLASTTKQELANNVPKLLEESAGTKNDRVPTGVRSIYILEVLAKAGKPMTPTEINEELELPKPTIHRLCQRLMSEGFLEMNLDGRRYVPGPRLRAISLGVITFASFLQPRHAILSRLSEEIGETCNITIPSGEGMRYLDRVETRWPLRVQFQIGDQVPFYCSASGKLYLSTLRKVQRRKLVNAMKLEKRGPNTITDPEKLLLTLEHIRREKLGTDNEELVDGMVAIAVPIEDKGGKFLGTLALHAPRHRLTFDDALEHAPLLREAAEELGGAIFELE